VLYCIVYYSVLSVVQRNTVYRTFLLISLKILCAFLIQKSRDRLVCGSDLRIKYGLAMALAKCDALCMGVQPAK